MTSIAFFAHDEKDAAIRRRVAAFERAGFEVAGFAMRRGERIDQGWNVVDLGRTYDAKYRQRIAAIASGARRAIAARDLLERADVVYARNLDMALCALIALGGLSKPFVYECLDIHRLMHRGDALGMMMRRLERFVLDRSALLVVSSPAFLREYFYSRHAGRFRAQLVENRLADSPALAPRPQERARQGAPLRIGWFGVLRCRRSLALLEDAAARLGPRVEIVLRGAPDVQLPDFHERIRRHRNIKYHGRYKSPEDLAAIYAGLDLVWAGDFHDAGFNSRWLLPNRLYEGGYFAVPAIAPGDSETGRWVTERSVGFAIAEPLEQSLPAFLHDCVEGRIDIETVRARLIRFPRDAFVQPASEMRSVIETAIAHHNARTPSAKRWFVLQRNLNHVRH